MSGIPVVGRFRWIFSLILMLTLTGCSLANAPLEATPSPSPNSAGATDRVSDSTINVGKPDNVSNQQAASVKIYLIAIDDQGKHGKILPTGDSLVGVERTIINPEAPLKGALTELFSLKERMYGQSGLYNALYQSNLQVDSASLTNGLAVVRLSGNFRLGGVLDNPRVEAQIKETALQFSTVKEVEVFVNGRKLEEVLSMK